MQTHKNGVFADDMSIQFVQQSKLLISFYKDLCDR